MARLGDLPHVFRTVGPWTFVRRIVKETFDDHVFTWAAALAYSWMFAIFPFLIFLLALLPYMPQQFKEPTRKQIDEQIGYVAPSAAGESLRSTLNQVLDRPAGSLLSIGILIALFGASGGMNATMAALDRCYDIEIGRRYVKQRSVAAVLTIGVAALIILVLCLVPVTTQLLGRFEIGGVTAMILNVSRYTVAAFLCLTILSLVYHFGPSVRSHWTWISPGSLFVLVVWALLAFGFRYYIDNFAAASYAKTYGVVGSIVLLLLVLYMDAIVLLIGAEINSEVDFAVLGLHSSANADDKSTARLELSAREQWMRDELRRRRPAAMAMMQIAGYGPAAAKPVDAAAEGPVYPTTDAPTTDAPAAKDAGTIEVSDQSLPRT